jgi:hypothetical protein
MSPWAAEQPEGTDGNPTAGAQLPWWIRLVSFFLSALFFLSTLFTVFAPLPILFARFRFGSRWAWAAALTNSLLVLFASRGDGFSLSVYLGFIITLALLMPKLIRPGATLGRIAGLTLLGMTAVTIIAVATYSAVENVNPWIEFKRQASSSVDFLFTWLPLASLPKGEMDQAEWKRQVIAEFPSTIMAFAIILVWTNLVLSLASGGHRSSSCGSRS